jgi:hypothetical protein
MNTTFDAPTCLSIFFITYQCTNGSYCCHLHFQSQDVFCMFIQNFKDRVYIICMQGLRVLKN